LDRVLEEKRKSENTHSPKLKKGRRDLDRKSALAPTIRVNTNRKSEIGGEGEILEGR